MLVLGSGQIGIVNMLTAKSMGASRVVVTGQSSFDIRQFQMCELYAILTSQFVGYLASVWMS